MTCKELTEALRLISRVSSHPRVEPGQRDQLQKARRELERISRSGKLDRRKLFLAVEVVAIVLQQIVEH
jgi:hypothetical protein